ncbi:hypothetical protein DIPPA_16418, partial [Diplonema papillatum]
AAALGDVPVAIVGDFNTNRESSDALACMLRTGWHDAAELCSDGAPPNTYERETTLGSRIDYILLSEVATRSLKSCSTDMVVDGEGCRIPQHSMLTVELQLDTYAELCDRYRMPRPLPVRELADVDAAEARGRLLLAGSPRLIPAT